MTDNIGRIKIAETVFGWTRHDSFNGWSRDREGFPTEFVNEALLPNPENDANHDYAVLEWMRKEYRVILYPDNPMRKYGDKWYIFVALVGQATEYKTGNYFRAALKVISND